MHLLCPLKEGASHEERHGGAQEFVVAYPIPEDEEDVDLDVFCEHLKGHIGSEAAYLAVKVHKGPVHWYIALLQYRKPPPGGGPYVTMKWNSELPWRGEAPSTWLLPLFSIPDDRRRTTFSPVMSRVFSVWRENVPEGTMYIEACEHTAQVYRPAVPPRRVSIGSRARKATSAKIMGGSAGITADTATATLRALEKEYHDTKAGHSNEEVPVDGVLSEKPSKEEKAARAEEYAKKISDARERAAQGPDDSKNSETSGNGGPGPRPKKGGKRRKNKPRPNETWRQALVDVKTAHSKA